MRYSQVEETFRFWFTLFAVTIFLQLAKCGPPKVCPIYCICFLKNNFNHADCSGSRLINPNSAVPYEVQSLDLSYNDITELDNNCFQGYNHLINMTIAHNALHTVFLDAFVPLKRIRAIDLSYNRLEFIDPRIFESNRKLHTLNLEGNKFMTLANAPLVHSKSLRTLNLANAQINVLLPEHYSRLPQLQELDLARNLIITIDKFAKQPPNQLLKLNLEENNLNCDQTLQTALKQLKARNVQIIYSNCPLADPAMKSAMAVEKKLERMELVDETRAGMEDEGDVGDSPENFDDAIRGGDLSGWHFPLSSDEDEDYYTDFDVDQNEEGDESLIAHNSSSELMNKTCRLWCYKNGWSKPFSKNDFNDAIDFSVKQYSNFDLLFALICGIAIGIALTIFIGSCIICIWRCASLKAKRVQVEDPYNNHYAAVRQAAAPLPPPRASRSTVDAIRRPSTRDPEPEPESGPTSTHERYPVVLPQPPRRRQRQRQCRHSSVQHAVVRHDQLADPGGNNFISRLFGRPARHQYYRTINENTATLIRRLSRSNLFNNRLSQHFGDRDRDRNTTNSSPNAPDSPDGVSDLNLDGELGGLSSATRTPHRRRPETPPPLYSEIVLKQTD
ncbi:uncharacterized protein LOC128863033 [Anastrepha ludens]|uniref:uncharacterized protein LOC128863033 n=1 Tax=Anastrepha ludens TaxID=28586 RepID=UPI0023AF9B9E|nr:uncharacterized protein LOC128863033 [Anastrepha ludens]